MPLVPHAPHAAPLAHTHAGTAAVHVCMRHACLTHTTLRTHHMIALCTLHIGMALSSGICYVLSRAQLRLTSAIIVCVILAGCSFHRTKRLQHHWLLNVMHSVHFFVGQLSLSAHGASLARANERVLYVLSPESRGVFGSSCSLVAGAHDLL
jgi:hypothetical protein